MLLKRNFRQYARTGPIAAKTRALGANVPHSPLPSRVIRYFTAHAISGFEARFSRLRRCNVRPKDTIRRGGVRTTARRGCEMEQRARSRAKQALQSPHHSNAAKAARQRPCYLQAGFVVAGRQWALTPTLPAGLHLALQPRPRRPSVSKQHRCFAQESGNAAITAPPYAHRYGLKSADPSTAFPTG